MPGTAPTYDTAQDAAQHAPLPRKDASQPDDASITRHPAARGETVPWSRIALLAALAFASTFSTAIVFPNIGSFVRDRFILSDTETSLFAVAYLLPHVVFAFVWGALSDRAGRRVPLLMFGYVMTALFHVSLPFVEDYSLLILIRIGEGTFSILGFSMVLTIAADYAKRGSYGRVMGTMGAAIALANTLAFPIGGAIGADSMIALCSFGAMILLICAVLVRLFLREGGHGRARTLREALLVLRGTPSLGIPYAFTFIDRFTVGFFAVTFPLYAGAVHGLDAAATGALLAGYLLPFSLLTYPFGRLTDHIGAVRLLLTGSVLYGIVVMFVGLVPIGWILPVMILSGTFAAFMYAPSLWMVAAYAPSAKRASAMGGFNAAGALGFAVGPAAGALISDMAGYPAAFIAAGVSELLCVFILYPLLARRSGPLSTSPVPDPGLL